MFIPIARDELAAIDGSVQLSDRAAHHVTPELLAALEYTAGQAEDAEYGVLSHQYQVSLSSLNTLILFFLELKYSRSSNICSLVSKLQSLTSTPIAFSSAFLKVFLR